MDLREKDILYVICSLANLCKTNERSLVLFISHSLCKIMRNENKEGCDRRLHIGRAC